ETPGKAAQERVRPRKIASRELLAFYRQSAKLIKSGVPILQTLFLLSQENEGGYFKQVLEDLHRRVREGNSLSDALSAYPRIFSSFDIGMLQTGEAAGRLDEVLSKVPDYRQKQHEFNSRVRGALAYPAFIFLMGAATVSF